MDAALVVQRLSLLLACRTHTAHDLAHLAVVRDGRQEDDVVDLEREMVLRLPRDGEGLDDLLRVLVEDHDAELRAEVGLDPCEDRLLASDDLDE